MSTSILDDIQEYRERKILENNIIVADKGFLHNIDNIKKIRNTAWYSMIKDYWTREFNDNLERIQNVNASRIEEVAKAQAKLELSKKFLTFLSSYENPLSTQIKKN